MQIPRNTLHILTLLLVLATSSCEKGSQGSSETSDRKIAVAGLSLNLAGTPQKAEFGLGKAADNTVSQDSFVLQDGSTQFAIQRTIHSYMDDSLDDNARGIVEGQEIFSIVDGYVDSLPAKRITLSVDAGGGNIQHVSVIIFAKNKTLWQVASIDPNASLAHGKLDKLIPTIKVTE